jgi:hypothetical protein
MAGTWPTFAGDHPFLLELLLKTALNKVNIYQRITHA